MTENLTNRLAIILIVLTLLLFTTKTLYIAPLLLLSVTGIVMLVLGKIDNHAPAYRLLSVLFLLLWLPIVLSSTDAVEPGRVYEKVLAAACLFPAGLLMLYSLGSLKCRRIVFVSIFVVLSFWIIDGSIQFFTGFDLFGYPYTPPQLMGMFYPKVRMPYLLAVLAPVFFEFIRLQMKTRKWLLLMLIPFGMMILLGGKRSAWIMLAFSGSGYLVYLYLLYQGIQLKKALAAAVIIALPLALLILSHAPLRDRVTSTLNIFSSDIRVIDQASAHRIDLWKVAIAIARDNWLNGVGPRGFRYVFNEYADENNFWIRAGFPDGTTHPHLQILEIASETGVIGLAGYLMFYFLLVWLLLVEIRAGRLSRMPWLLCPLTAFFPLNAHLAFFGTYWTCVGWWVLCVSLAEIYTRPDDEDPDN